MSNSLAKKLNAVTKTSKYVVRKLNSAEVCEAVSKLPHLELLGVNQSDWSVWKGMQVGIQMRPCGQFIVFSY